MSENSEFVSKKKNLKSEIKYKIELSEEQKEAVKLIINNKVTALWGLAGTAKTTCGIRAALHLAFTQGMKIYLLRPAVEMESIGFLKGSAEEKLQYYLIPMLSALYKNYDKSKIDKDLEEKKIEIIPLGFIQGITIENAILICDEAENITEKQMRMILTRLGKGSKTVFTGDIDQIMLKNTKESGFKKLIDLEGKIEGLAVMELKENRRDPFVQEILKLY